RWLAKSDLLWNDQGQIDESNMIEGICKEVIANRIYGAFGVPIARLATANLPLITPSDDITLVMASEAGYLLPDRVFCLVSRYLDHFKPYGYLPRLRDLAGKSE